jgi:hypothetical protein
MAIIPAGEKKKGQLMFSEVYEDEEGLFWIVERTLAEIIEANVTNGRGFIPKEYDPFKTPFAEHKIQDFRDGKKM